MSENYRCGYPNVMPTVTKACGKFADIPLFEWEDGDTSWACRKHARKFIRMESKRIRQNKIRMG